MTRSTSRSGRWIVLAIVGLGAGMGLAGLLLREARGPSLPLKPGAIIVVTWESSTREQGVRVARDSDSRITHFELAVAPSSELAANLGALFTGKMPRESGLVRAGDALRGELPTLAEIVAAQGFATAAFVAVGALDGEALKRSGLAHGFATVVASAGTSDAELATKAAAWLAARGTAPSLAWLHWKTDAAIDGLLAQLRERAVDDHALVVAAGPLAGETSGTTGARPLARGGFTSLSLQLPVALLPLRVDPQVVSLVDVVASVAEAFGIRAPDGIGTPYLLHPDVREAHLVLATRPLAGAFADADEVWLYSNRATYVNAPARGESETWREGRPWSASGDGGGLHDLDGPNLEQARQVVAERFGYRFEEVELAELLKSEAARSPPPVVNAESMPARVPIARSTRSRASK